MTDRPDLAAPAMPTASPRTATDDCEHTDIEETFSMDDPPGQREAWLYCRACDTHWQPRREVLKLLAEAAQQAASLDVELRGDGPCADCGTLDNPVWFTDNILWNTVTGESVYAEEAHGAILCINCFVTRARNAGLRPTGWHVSAEWPYARLAPVHLPSNAIQIPLDSDQRLHLALADAARTADGPARPADAALDPVNVASVAMSKGEREGIAECIRYIDLELEHWRDHHDQIGPTVVGALENVRTAIERDAHLSGATRILLERAQQPTPAEGE